MSGKQQVTIFLKKILEDKILVAMLLVMFTLPLHRSIPSQYAINDPMYIAIILAIFGLIIPSSRLFIEKYIKLIKNTIAFIAIVPTVAWHFINNYGSIAIGGKILVILSILLILDNNPIIINSIKKWWTTANDEDSKNIK